MLCASRVSTAGFRRSDPSSRRRSGPKGLPVPTCEGLASRPHEANITPIRSVEECSFCDLVRHWVFVALYVLSIPVMGWGDRRPVRVSGRSRWRRTVPRGSNTASPTVRYEVSAMRTNVHTKNKVRSRYEGPRGKSTYVM